MVLDLLTAIGAALIVFFFLLGGLYLWDPEISEKVWLGTLLLLVGVTILFILIGTPDLGIIIIGVIGGLVGRVVLDRIGIAQQKQQPKKQPQRPPPIDPKTKQY